MGRKKYQQAPPPKKGFLTPGRLMIIVPALFILGGVAQRAPEILRWAESTAQHAANAKQHPPLDLTPYNETPEEALARIKADHKIINTHEHMENEACVKNWLQTMDDSGMAKTILVGSSWFTITMNEKYGFTRYDENNENLMGIAAKWPDKFEAWPTVNPLDPDKLAKVKDLHARGASGFKLYSGHGYIRKDNGDYMFHPIAMDDPQMFPVYAYWQENHIPICMHVNPYEKGFSQELIAVLTAFPDMKVITPHFILSSIRDTRMREFLDTFPNLYSDISFGHDDFLIAGITRISKNTAKFKQIFADYPDRFFFGSDLVITEYEAKTPAWCDIRMQAYFDMLTKKDYTTELVPGETLHGLELRGPLLDRVLYENFVAFEALKPEGTKILRAIDWSRMGVDEIERSPGQAFPAERKKKK